MELSTLGRDALFFCIIFIHSIRLGDIFLEPCRTEHSTNSKFNNVCLMYNIVSSLNRRSFDLKVKLKAKKIHPQRIRADRVGRVLWGYLCVLGFIVEPLMNLQSSQGNTYKQIKPFQLHHFYHSSLGIFTF